MGLDPWKLGYVQVVLNLSQVGLCQFIFSLVEMSEWEFSLLYIHTSTW